jgi:hypothetical protein
MLTILLSRDELAQTTRGRVALPPPLRRGAILTPDETTAGGDDAGGLNAR